MNEIEIQEKLVEIAKRIPMGDSWEVNEVEKIQPSLTDALEAYYQIAEIKPKSFRLNLDEGKLYAIFPEQVEIKKPESKKYSIYGEYIFQ
jgi:hypothetical protein